MSRCRKISTDISVDGKVNELSDQAALLYTWAIPHFNDDCRITARNSKEVQMAVVPGRKWSEKEVKKYMEELFSAGLWGVDENKRIFIPSDSFYKYQTYINSEKRQETPRISISPSPSPSLKEDNTSPFTRSWPDPFLLIEKYNREVCDDLPAVEKVTPARIKKARDYLKLFPDEQFWTEVFKQVNASVFLRGKSNGTGHGSFRGDFDWLLTKGKDGTENVAKVWEGKYNS